MRNPQNHQEIVDQNSFQWLSSPLFKSAQSKPLDVRMEKYDFN